MVIGIDQSLTGTGIVVLDSKKSMIFKKLIVTKPKDFDQEIERLIHIREEIKKINKSFNIKLSVLEGFGFGARGDAIFQLAGLGYLIREYFYTENIPLKIVPPTTLKKFITGRGNCGKDLILLNVYKKWGVEFTDDNLADAYGLAMYGLENFSKE